MECWTAEDLLHSLVRFKIDRARRFVQDEDLGVP
jgi:hypothetical protein